MPLSLVVQSAVLRGVRGRPTSVRVLVPVSSILASHDSEDAIVRAALSQLGIPHAPYIAEITSDATRSFDSANLAIALALLAAHDKVPATALEDVLVLGHLRMDASIQAVCGTLPMLMGVRSENRPLTVLLPRENLREAQLLPGLILLPADSLGEAAAALCRIDRPLPTVHPQLTIPISSDDPRDMDASKFSPHVLNGLEVAAAGNHNILLVGSPGSGTTWLARRLHSLLPPLTPDEALTVTAHCSAAGQLPANVFITERPFRAPHHTVSTTALIGQSYSPGELTLRRATARPTQRVSLQHSPFHRLGRPGEASHNPTRDRRLGYHASLLAGRRDDDRLPVRLAGPSRRPLWLHTTADRSPSHAHPAAVHEPLRSCSAPHLGVIRFRGQIN